MKDLSKKIYELIQSGKADTLDRSMIQKGLEMTSTKEFIALDNCLNRLEEQGLIYRGKNNTYRTAEQKGLVIGKVHLNKRGRGYVDRENKPSIMIYEEKLKGAMEGDEVLVRITSRARLYLDEQCDTGTVVRVLSHCKDYLVGTFLRNGFGLRFIPDDTKLENRECTFICDDDFEPIEGMKVKTKIVSYQPFQVEYVETLGHMDDPGVDILSVLLDHGIESEFSEDVMKQVDKIPSVVYEDEYTGRKDLTKEMFVTIDGDDSKDFDDAICVVKKENGWKLFVNIADVSHYVTEGSPLDVSAFERGTSTYVTDRVVPMLPHELSNGICSLNPHVVRLTLTVEMDVNTDGKITSYKVYPSYMESKMRMTYNNVNRIFEGDEALIEEYLPFVSMFMDMKDCALAIRKNRHNKGAIDFDTVESKIVCDETGKAIDIVERERGLAEECIEDFMIAANVSVANLMKKHKIPCVYRIHEEPQSKKMVDFVRMSKFMTHTFMVNGTVTPKQVQEYLESCKNDPDYDVVSMALLRCMSKAVYDPECVGHFGLAEEEYLHFTSPIRRYPDLIVHRMLRKYFFEHNEADLAVDTNKMAEISEQSSIRERASADAEYEVIDMKKAEYMEQFIGQEFKGLITSVTSFGMYVQLDNTCEGLVHVENMVDFFEYDEYTMTLRGAYSGLSYRPGMHVVVKVMSANKKTRTVDFTLVQGTSVPEGFKEDAHRKARSAKNEAFKERERERDAARALKKAKRDAKKDELLDHNNYASRGFGKKEVREFKREGSDVKSYNEREEKKDRRTSKRDSSSSRRKEFTAKKFDRKKSGYGSKSHGGKRDFGNKKRAGHTAKKGVGHARRKTK